MKNKKQDYKIIDTNQESSITDSSDTTGKDKSGKDLTGRDNIASSVIYSWIGHLVLIIAGFIMPRIIDFKLNPKLLDK
ncbi:MAG: hypothetical protein JXA96_06120 [Sedimentisphaerales bacterium]|nr:hypothetical protein [Sedimentisphaerales bacterium]